MLDSIKGQFDKTRVYFNNISKRPDFIPDWVEVVCGGKQDLTDNGKFFFIKDDEYYFTLDDDLVYPPTYAEDMVRDIDRTHGIVTHHGRILLKPGVSYYKNHKCYRCLGANAYETRIDVAGSGVSAWDTRVFKPTLWNSQYLKMADLVLSLEAAKKDVHITVLRHDADYFGYLNPDEKTTIYYQVSSTAYFQNILADNIYYLKNK
jgi:hypothetical protein